MVKSILKGSIFGMPRWLFFSLLLGGIALGIYLRRRSAAEDAGDTAEDYGPYDEPIAQLPTDADSVAGGISEGIVTQPAAGVIPVTTPYIPEGLTEIVGGLSGALTEVALREPPDAYYPPEPAPAPATPTTGGGPPKRRPHTRPKPQPKPTRARYLANLRSIRKRHGANSAEVKRFRQRHPSGKA